MNKREFTFAFFGVLAGGAITSIFFTKDKIAPFVNDKFSSRISPNNFLATSNKSICEPAPEMKERADKFRENFVRNYLVPKVPYAFAIALFDAQIRSESFDATRVLVNRGPMIIKGDEDGKRQLINPDPNAQNYDDINFEVTEPYTMLFKKQEIKVKVTIPAPLIINALYDNNSLLLEAQTSLVFRTNGSFQDGGQTYPLPKVLSLLSVNINQQELRYEFLIGTSGSDKVNVIMKFDTQC